LRFDLLLVAKINSIYTYTNHQKKRCNLEVGDKLRKKKWVVDISVSSLGLRHL